MSLCPASVIHLALVIFRYIGLKLPHLTGYEVRACCLHDMVETTYCLKHVHSNKTSTHTCKNNNVMHFWELIMEALILTHPLIHALAFIPGYVLSNAVPSS